MPALDQQIGGGDHPAVGRADDRGVVTDAEQRPAVGRQQPRNGRDQAELA